MSAMHPNEIRALHYATGEPIRIRWNTQAIERMEPAPGAPPELWVAPPLFDLQINGFAGVDFQQNHLDPDQLLRAVRQLHAAGCGQFLLTLITDEWTALTRRLLHFRSLRQAHPELQNAIAGWHVEGPFLSPEPGFAGAHPPDFMRDPNPALISELREITGSDPLLITLAPERSGALEAIAVAVSLGCTVSLGHTNAPAALLQKAVQAGARGFTHLGNGCPQTLDRHDNILWRVFETPGLTASLIPDQIHVSPPLFRIVHQALGANRIFYTTDAMSAAGAPPGFYPLGKLRLEVGPDRVVRHPGKSNYAGSALTPIEAVFRAAEMLRLSWQKTWPYLSTQPAAFMGLPLELKTGFPANFCLIQETPGRNKITTWLQGKQIGQTEVALSESSGKAGGLR